MPRRRRDTEDLTHTGQAQNPILAAQRALALHLAEVDEELCRARNRMLYMITAGFLIVLVTSIVLTIYIANRTTDRLRRIEDVLMKSKPA